MNSLTNIMFAFVSGLLGLGLGFVGMWLYFRWKKPNRTTLQATTLLEKVRRVCKVVTVEGEFTEIVNVQNEKWWAGFVPQNKKALIVIKAKVMVGYDMQKVQLTPLADQRCIRVDRMPEPEVLSIEDEIVYFDLRQSIFNPFKGKEHAELHAKAKETIREKVKESELPAVAEKQAMQLIALISEIAAIEGWTIDTTKLLDEKTKG